MSGLSTSFRNFRNGNGRVKIINKVIGSIAIFFERHRQDRIRDERPDRIILIRHGESLGNVDKRLFATIADAHFPLSPKGEQQAFDAGKRLQQLIGNERVSFFVSPFKRTQMTLNNIMESLAPHQIASIRQDPRYSIRSLVQVREQEWGNFQDPDQMPAIFEERNRVGRFWYRFPTGESGADVYERVSTFLDSVFRELNDGQQSRAEPVQNIVIVTHGLLMRLFCMRFFRWSVETFETVWNPQNCEMWVLRKNENGHYELSKEAAYPRSTRDVNVHFTDGRIEKRLITDYIDIAEPRDRNWAAFAENLGISEKDVKRWDFDMDEKNP